MNVPLPHLPGGQARTILVGSAASRPPMSGTMLGFFRRKGGI